MILPIGHENSEVRRLPWVTFTIMALCVIIFLFTNKKLESSLNETKEYLTKIYYYYVDRPYLEFNLFKQLLPEESEKDSQIEDYFKSRRRMEEPDEETLIDEQEYLDGLIKKLVQIKDDNPIRKWGLIPAKRTFITSISHMFLHGSWLHLLGNLFFLYLMGPFLEDMWGRQFYAAFYIVAGIISGLAYSLHFPEFNGPLIGASGAISGVIAAFLVRFWKIRIKFVYWVYFFFGTFTAPAWFMLIFEVVRELYYAKMNNMLSETGAGVAYWAHFWGLFFGAAVALVFIKMKIEEKYVNPKIEGEISFVDQSYKEYEKALEIIDNGDLEGGYAKLYEMKSLVNKHPEIGEVLWKVSERLGREREAAPVLMNTIIAEIKKNQLDYALTNYWQLKSKFPETMINDIYMKVLLTEKLIEKDDGKGSEELLMEIINEVDENSPSGVMLRICDSARIFDKTFNRSIYPVVANIAIQNLNISSERKQRLKDEIKRQQR